MSASLENTTKKLFNNYLKWIHDENKEDNISNYVYWYREVNEIDLFESAKH